MTTTSSRLECHPVTCVIRFLKKPRRSLLSPPPASLAITSFARSASGCARASPQTENSAFGSWREQLVLGKRLSFMYRLDHSRRQLPYRMRNNLPQRVRSDPRPAVALITAAAHIQRKNTATASPASSPPPPPRTYADLSLQPRADTVKLPDIISKFWRFVTRDSGLHDCHTW